MLSAWDRVLLELEELGVGKIQVLVTKSKNRNSISRTNTVARKYPLTSICMCVYILGLYTHVYFSHK